MSAEALHLEKLLYSEVVPSKNKAPIDGYSRGEFEDGLVALEASGITYTPRSPGRDESKEWKFIQAATTDEEKAILTTLDRLYANAQRAAEKEGETRESATFTRAVIPKIAEIENSVRLKLNEPEKLPPRALVFGRALMDAAAEAKMAISTQRPEPPPTTTVEKFRDIADLYLKFTDASRPSLAQDRFGRSRDRNPQ